MSELVGVCQALPDAAVDFRYATSRNIAGRPLYPAGTEMLIARTMINPLQTVCQNLGSQGLRLVFWDAHREPDVQRILRAIQPDEQYVQEFSNHVIDKAVDVTLTNEDGVILDMGTDFDEFSALAYRNTDKLSVEQLLNRQALEKPMLTAGFEGLPSEWWHYNYIGLDDGA